MRISIISGKHRGRDGEMRGDLDERKRTLGKDGKVQVWLPGNSFPVFVRTKHLDNQLPLPLGDGLTRDNPHRST